MHRTRAAITLWSALLSLAFLGACATEEPTDTESPTNAGLTERLASLQTDLGPGSNGAAVRTVQEYLHNFGYFPNPELQERYPAWRPMVAREPAWGSYDDTTADAVVHLQRQMGLEQTGIVDEATRELLARERCGHPDGHMHMDEDAKFDLRPGKRIPGSTITWRIDGWPRAGSASANNMSRDVIRAQLRAAMTTWSNTADVRFAESTATDANIIFGWFNNCTAPQRPCTDGLFATTNQQPPGILTIAFDEVRNFTAGAAPGTAPDFPSVAIHELGHALGLDHSSSFGVMRADIGYNALRTPNADDAVAARAHYNDWVNLNRQAQDIGASTNSVWIISTSPMQYGFRIQKLAGSGFVNESANGGAVRIAVGSDHIPWIVDSAGNVHQRTSADHTTGTWTWRSGGCATDIGVGGGVAWILGCTRLSGGYEAYRWSGSAWTRDSSGRTGTRIAVDRTGRPIISNEARQVWRKSSSSATSGSWSQLTGMVANDVGVGQAGTVPVVWSVASSNLFVFSEQISQAAPARYTTPRNMVAVTVGATSTPWGIDISGNIFRSRF
jgi:peptidoglycan hydrolase-like protein with peptidoglycan-binding domain